MKNLAPQIYRQRLIIEGKSSFQITGKHIRKYLNGLSEKLGMRVLAKPITHRSENFGWAGWIHWETSGTHFYAWDQPFPFFSADAYACKKFDVETAIKYTSEFFQTSEVAYESV